MDEEQDRLRLLPNLRFGPHIECEAVLSHSIALALDGVQVLLGCRRKMISSGCEDAVVGLGGISRAHQAV